MTDEGNLGPRKPSPIGIGAIVAVGRWWRGDCVTCGAPVAGHLPIWQRPWPENAPSATMAFVSEVSLVLAAIRHRYCQPSCAYVETGGNHERCALDGSVR